MFNAQQFCQDYFIQYETKGRHTSSGWIGVNCPFCSDSTFHGGFNIAKGYYSCWKCGGSSLEKIIKQLLRISSVEALELKEAYTINTIQTTHKKTEHPEKIEMIGEELRSVHKKYLKARNFSPEELMEKYHLTGTITSPAPYKYRLIVPIFHSGKLISFQGRDVTGEQELRWKGLSPEKSVMNYKHTLYGLSNTSLDQVGVVEGIADQWRMGDGFVATFGTAMTNQQIKLLSRFKKVFLLYDPDAFDKSQQYAKHIKAINPRAVVEYIDMEIPQGSDPAELNEKEVRYFRRELGFI